MKTPPKGRNRYAKKCAVCGVIVPVYKGLLKKNGDKYDVVHDDCKDKYVKVESQPKKKKKQSVDADDTEILNILEAKLVERKLKGEPVIMLPLIIDYIKSLHLKIEQLSK